MAVEARTLLEGTLRWTQAGSGTGGTVSTGWVTASAAQTGLIGYVQAGQNYDRAFNVQTIMDRGIPKHHKIVQQNPIELDFTVLYAVTGDWPAMNPFVTASGFSVPMWHFEWKQHDTEVAGKAVPFTGTGIYTQFHNATLLSFRPSEADNGNTIAMKFRAIAVVGPTGSGYLS
jgi:hypothetical protein